MSKSVSNDALWEKLSEISEQLISSKQTGNVLDSSGFKNEIFAEIDRQTSKLGNHYDLNHKANADNWKVTNENVRTIHNIVSRIRKQQKETAELQTDNDTEQQLEVLETQADDNWEYFNFRFFKLRKTSVVITILGSLVFILTTFCMKQQNDYSVLNGEYYRSRIEIRKIQVKMCSLRNALKPNIEKKR